MTFTLIIALNLSLSILAMLVVYGCLFLAHRLPAGSAPDADWRDWGQPLPVALLTNEEIKAGHEVPDYAAAAA